MAAGRPPENIVVLRGLAKTQTRALKKPFTILSHVDDNVHYLLFVRPGLRTLSMVHGAASQVQALVEMRSINWTVNTVFLCCPGQELQCKLAVLWRNGLANDIRNQRRNRIMLKEFKEFALKGNMLDMAVGIVIGAAFSAIVSSLVDDIIMPPIGLLLGGVDFSSIFVVMKGGAEGATYATVDAAKEAGAVTWNVGLFANAVIKFLIVAFALFMVVKGMNRLRRKEEAAPLAKAEAPREQILLEEIRDLLKK